MGSLSLGTLFQGALVKLGPVRPEDKDAFSRWSHDADYTRNMNFNPALPRSPEYFEERAKKEENVRDDDFMFGLRTLADDKLIGISGFWVMWNYQTAWFWIGIGEPDYRGKGYGTDATRLTVSYAFRELGLHRVALGVFGFNKRAVRTYEKVGFVHEGAQRSVLYRDGERHDLLGMSILRHEWEAQQQSDAAGSLEKVY